MKSFQLVIRMICSISLLATLPACNGGNDRYMSPANFGVQAGEDARAAKQREEDQGATDKQQGSNGSSDAVVDTDNNGDGMGSEDMGDGDKADEGKADDAMMPPGTKTDSTTPKDSTTPPVADTKAPEAPKMATLMIKIKEEAIIKKCGTLPKLIFKYSYQGKMGEGEISYKDQYGMAEIKDLVANKKDNLSVEVYQGTNLKFSVKFEGLILAEGASAIEVADLK